MCVCSNIFSETTGPVEAKFHVEPSWDREKVYSNGPGGGPGHLLFFIIVNLRFYHNFVPAVQGV